MEVTKKTSEKASTIDLTIVKTSAATNDYYVTVFGVDIKIPQHLYEDLDREAGCGVDEDFI